jgi:hypothetical protein
VTRQGAADTQPRGQLQPRDPALVAAERVARLMDGLHLDPILGLVAPWAGDLVGAGMGLYPLVLAWRRGAPASLIARMLLNLTVDLVSGAVPVVGDLFDFFFRAHRRNLHLLRARWQPVSMGPLKGSPNPPAMVRAGQSPAAPHAVIRSSGRDALVVAAALTLFLAALALPVVLLVVAVRAVIS